MGRCIIGDECMERLEIENSVVRNVFIMNNYMLSYNVVQDGITILIPERKINGEGELEYKPEQPKSP